MNFEEQIADVGKRKPQESIHCICEEALQAIDIKRLELPLV